MQSNDVWCKLQSSNVVQFNNTQHVSDQNAIIIAPFMLYLLWMQSRVAIGLGFLPVTHANKTTPKPHPVIKLLINHYARAQRGYPISHAH